MEKTNELDFLVRVVKEASELITDEFVESKKQGGELVTNFDVDIELHIIKRINEEFPDFDVVSEETNCKKELTDNCFIIDPIDGTRNFTVGIPLWGIQAACVRDGEAVAAVIYLPKLDEMYTADKNGAFLNGKPIKVREHIKAKTLNIVEGKRSLVHRKLVTLPEDTIFRRYGCTAVAFAWLAAGRLSSVNYIDHMLWDYYPGMYLVKQAGGVEGEHFIIGRDQ